MPMNPREYLLARDWEVADEAEELASIIPHMRPWTDPIYRERCDFPEAVTTQTQWDVEKLGGYEALMGLADATGIKPEF